MKYLSAFLLFIPLLVLQSCKTAEPTTNTEQQDSTYVFDSPMIDSVEVFPEPEITKNEGATFFAVQVGAFSTREKAEKFAELSRLSLNKEISVVYGTNNHLYVVQIKDMYADKKDAVVLRNGVRKNENYKDAFIVKIIK